MDTANLDRVEILKGPASLLSGEGATGGAINYVTKVPHTGPIVNEAFRRLRFVQGVSRRLWIGRQHPDRRAGLSLRRQPLQQQEFHRRHLFASSPMFQASSTTRSPTASRSGARSNTSRTRTDSTGARRWCRPMRPESFRPPASSRAPGSNYYLERTHGHARIRSRSTPARCRRPTTCSTTTTAPMSCGCAAAFQWDITNNVQLKSQVYAYNAQRHWFNNEINAFNDNPRQRELRAGLSRATVGRSRPEALRQRHRSHGQLQSRRDSTTASWRRLPPAACSSTSCRTISSTTTSSTWSNPDRGLYGVQQTKNFYTHVDNVSLSFEDRIKLTSNFALIGGIRVEEIDLSRTAFDVDGNLRSAAGYPFSTTFRPSRVASATPGKRCPGLTFYSQYATAADPTVANIFNLRPTQPLLLTTSRIYETGVKHAVLRTRRRNSRSRRSISNARTSTFPKAAILFNVAGKIASQGVEVAGAVNPFGGLKLWGNVAIVQSRFVNFDYVDGNGVAQSYSGKTPPNVPSFVANAGASYRFETAWPVEIGASAAPCRRPLQLSGQSRHHECLYALRTPMRSSTSRSRYSTASVKPGYRSA